MSEYRPVLDPEAREALSRTVARAQAGEIPPATVGDYFDDASMRALEFIESIPSRIAEYKLGKAVDLLEAGRPLTVKQIGLLASNGIAVKYNPLRPFVK